jgi:predicted dienelactone hydrolase
MYIFEIRNDIMIKKLAALFFCCLIPEVNAAEEIYGAVPPVAPALSAYGQYKVGVRTIKVTHQGQLSATDFRSTVDRQLTLEVWYPAGDNRANAKTTYEHSTRLHKRFEINANAYRDVPSAEGGGFPLVVLSHGYTGYRTIMYYMGEHLASHGYVVIGIDHTDSTTAEVDFKNSPFSGFVSTLMNRSRDQQFVLDYFADEKTWLSESLDTDRAALIGYSMGGYGAVNTVGGCYNFNVEGLKQLGFPAEAAENLAPVFNFCSAGRDAPDPRWKSMIAYAPWGQERDLHQTQALSEIKAPSLYVVGEHDDVSGYENGVKKLYQQTGTKDTHMLVYKQARHNVAPHPAPKVAYEHADDYGHYYEPVWSNQTLNLINQHFNLAFLDCYVKEQQSQCDMLPKEGRATQIKDSEGSFNSAWPGFSDRFGMGMEYYRKD